MKQIIKLSIIAIFLVIPIDLWAQSYSVDTEESKLKWTGEKITGFHEGYIELKSGDLVLEDHKITKGEFIVDMNSIVVTDLSGESKTKLENHLKSDDFFGTANYPNAKLRIKKSESFETGYAEVKADLTIKGITHPITFKTIRTKTDDKYIYYTKITIDRTLYNVKYGSGKFFDNLGDKTIFDNFEVEVKIVLKRQ